MKTPLVVDIIQAVVGMNSTILSIGPDALPCGSLGTRFVVRVEKGLFDQVFGGTWDERSQAFREAFVGFVQ